MSKARSRLHGMAKQLAAEQEEYASLSRQWSDAPNEDELVEAIEIVYRTLTLDCGATVGPHQGDIAPGAAEDALIELASLVSNAAKQVVDNDTLSILAKINGVDVYRDPKRPNKILAIPSFTQPKSLDPTYYGAGGDVSNEVTDDIVILKNGDGEAVSGSNEVMDLKFTHPKLRYRGFEFDLRDSTDCFTTYSAIVNAYDTKPSMDQAKTGLAKFMKMANYFKHVEEVVTGHVVPLLKVRTVSIAVIGCGRTMNVDFDRLNKSGLFGAPRGDGCRINLHFVDPALQGGVFRGIQVPKWVNVFSYRGTFREFASYSSKRSHYYDVVLFPMSLHVCIGENGEFEFAQVLESIMHPKGRAVGVAPHPGIYVNQVFALACDYNVVDVKDRYATVISSDGSRFIDYIPDYVALARYMAESDFAFSAGSSMNPSLFVPTPRFGRDYNLTFCFAPLSFRRDFRCAPEFPMLTSELSYNYYDRFHTSKPTQATMADLHRIEQSLGYFLSPKLDLEEGIIAISPTGYSLNLKTGSCFSKPSDFDASVAHDVIFYQCECAVVGDEVRRVVLIDVIASNGSTNTTIDISRASFCSRLEFLIRNNLGWETQRYTSDQEEITYSAEGVVITPVHGSLIVSNGGKKQFGSCYSVKRPDMTDFCIRVTGHTGSGEQGTSYVQFKMTPNGFVFDRLRFSKDRPSVPPKNIIDIPLFEKFHKANPFKHYQQKMFDDCQDFDEIDVSIIVKFLMIEMLGRKNWFNNIPKTLMAKMMQSDHPLYWTKTGARCCCVVCKSYHNYVSSRGAYCPYVGGRIRLDVRPGLRHSPSPISH